MATANIGSMVQKAPIRSVVVVGGITNFFDVIRGTTKSVNGEQAGILEMFMNKTELENAIKGGYSLEVLPKGLLEVAGWCRINRRSSRFDSVSSMEAHLLKRRKGMCEVLFVDQSAIDATKSPQPLELRLYWDNFIESKERHFGLFGYSVFKYPHFGRPVIVVNESPNPTLLAMGRK
jgi:hypothetical protein